MEDLPSGTVTMLFTDIEGSTRLVRRLGAGWSTALDEHAESSQVPFAVGWAWFVTAAVERTDARFEEAATAARRSVEGFRAMDTPGWVALASL